MAKRKKLVLTSEWLAQWSPSRSEEVSDKGCKGLSLIGGPNGIKTFYRFESVRDSVTGEPKRARVRLGRFPAMTLAEAREKVNEAREGKRTDLPGTALTVAQLADWYRKDVLRPNRESADDLWETIRIHILEAKPDPRSPAFGEWPARDVRAPEVGAVVRAAKEQRVVSGHRHGGTRTAAVVLRELKSIFAHGVGMGALPTTPAGTLTASAFGLGSNERDRYLDANEIQELFKALDLTALLKGTAVPCRLSETVRLGIAFQLYVPTRSQSLIGARWEEFDFEAKRWTVPPERIKVRSKKDRSKARPFVVPLAPTAVAILEKLRELAGESPWVLASPLEPQGHVEPKALIRALTRLQEPGADSKVRLALGSPVTVHDLRRTWRTWAEEHGVDDTVAEKCMGHKAAMQRKGFSRAADVYARAERIDQRAAAMELVAAAFDRIRLGAAAPVVPLAQARA